MESIKYNQTLVRRAITKIFKIINAEKGGEKGNHPIPLMECKLVQPLWKTIHRFLKKLKIELPNDPIILFLGIYQEKL